MTAKMIANSNSQIPNEGCFRSGSLLSMASDTAKSLYQNIEHLNSDTKAPHIRLSLLRCKASSKPETKDLTERMAVYEYNY